jgi:hypothetical protein
MASLKTYGRTLWDLQQTVGNRIGFDVRQSSMEFRAILIMVDASLSLLIKALVDKGVFTDLELNAAVQGVRDTTFARLGKPPLPDTSAPGTPVYPFPEPLQD